MNKLLCFLICGKKNVGRKKIIDKLNRKKCQCGISNEQIESIGKAYLEFKEFAGIFETD